MVVLSRGGHGVAVFGRGVGGAQMVGAVDVVDVTPGPVLDAVGAAFVRRDDGRRVRDSGPRDGAAPTAVHVRVLRRRGLRRDGRTLGG